MGNLDIDAIRIFYNLTDTIVLVFGKIAPARVVENQYIFEPNTLLAFITISIFGRLFFELVDKAVYIQQKIHQSKKPTVTELQYINQKNQTVKKK